MIFPNSWFSAWVCVTPNGQLLAHNNVNEGLSFHLTDFYTLIHGGCPSGKPCRLVAEHSKRVAQEYASRHNREVGRKAAMAGWRVKVVKVNFYASESSIEKRWS